MASTSLLPVMDLKRTNDLVQAELRAALLSVLDSGWLVRGPRARAFEAAWADYVGARHCLGVANGTDALEIVLRAAGAGGCEVIVTANAGGYATIACRLAAAVPVFADVDPSTHTIAVAAALDLVTPATRVIVATHLYGNLADVAGLRRGLERIGRRDVIILEDCAQAHGLADDAGRRVGALGDAAVFSFYPTKNLGALGDAGAIVTGDDSLFAEVTALHQYGWTTQYRSERPFGRNSRLDELQAAVLLSKLPHLDAWNEQRISAAAAYRQAAPDLRWVTGSGPSVAHLCVIEVDRRDALAAHLHRRGVATAIHYPILDVDQPAQRHLASRSGPLDASRALVGRILTLPCFPGMKTSEIEQVCAGLLDLKSLTP